MQYHLTLVRMSIMKKTKEKGLVRTWETGSPRTLLVDCK
jgi:hypothetical protein